jgi:hypothetical protein
MVPFDIVSHFCGYEYCRLLSGRGKRSARRV